MSSNSHPSTTVPQSNSEERRRSSGRTPRKVYVVSTKFYFDEKQRKRVLTPVEAQRLVQETGAPEISIRNWFQTRRIKERRSLLLADNDPGAGCSISPQIEVFLH